MFASFGAQAGFAFIAFFTKVSSTFNVSTNRAANYFSIMILVSALFRPMAGWLADSLRTETGFFRFASKNLMCLLLILQTVLFWRLKFLEDEGMYGEYVVTVTGIICLFAGSACAAAILARDMFGEKNSAIVFGVGGAVAMGFGEYISIQTLGWFSRNGDELGPKKFDGFYSICAFWSIAAFMASLTMNEVVKREINRTSEEPYEVI